MPRVLDWVKLGHPDCTLVVLPRALPDQELMLELFTGVVEFLDGGLMPAWHWVLMDEHRGVGSRIEVVPRACVHDA